MSTRPYILSIAGFDPSGGAGVLADVKTAEQHKVIGLAVTTSITYQTENQFLGMEWLSRAQIINQLLPLFDKYDIKAIKIGLISIKQLEAVLDVIPKEIPVIWDPILSASTGFEFGNIFDKEKLILIQEKIELITPNLLEYNKLKLENNKKTNILLKGGHQENHKNDILILFNGESHTIQGETFEKAYQKHGTGCTLSSAIAANIALGYDLLESCTLGKKYVESVLKSNDGLLGYHTS